MARTNNLTNFLTDVASAIKTKTGDSTPIPASQFDTKISNITTGHLDNTEYQEANDDLDDILEGSTPTTIYPPDWSQIGYEDTPQGIIEGFNYAKEIKDNWDSSSIVLSSKFAGNTNLRFMPLVDTSNALVMQGMFSNCTNLISISQFDTSKVTNMQTMFLKCDGLINLDVSNFNTSNVTNMQLMFYQCSELINLDVSNFDINKVTNMSGMFEGCSKLSNESLNSIMKMCINGTSYTGTKTLKYIGLTSAQATTCQTLSNYNDFIAAGWTTGY